MISNNHVRFKKGINIPLYLSSNVMRFTVTYMHTEKLMWGRFNILVLLFVASMNMLIFFPSFFTLLMGWDGLGLTSFLLVIYYQNPKSLGAGMITALTNRMGDAMLLLGVALSLNTNNWLIINMWNSNFDLIIILLIMTAAMTKSAQLPFSSWLPAAMAAPTPVSALVHSSTLVTAGVFLLIRFHSYLCQIILFETMLLVMATMTMFMAAFAAMFECDLKKIIALSTLSQLSVMMTSLALGLPKLALFHLLTHALFKALLFICAGSFISMSAHNQDLRYFGNMMNQAPLTASCFTIGNMSLCGLPFLSGFYSKDLIIELMMFNTSNMIMLLIILMATGGTAMYSIRLSVFALFNSHMNLPFNNINDEDTNILQPILLLTSGAVIAGAIMNWAFYPFSTEAFLPINIKLIPLYLVVLGSFMTLMMNTSLSSSFSMLQFSPITHEAFCTMWFLSPLSTQLPLLLMKPAYLFLKSIDHGWLEMMSANGLMMTFSSFSRLTQPTQSKSITSVLTISVILAIGILSFK
uniref:NADH-ubiquinone oxidoreductase chain 5 n=1 Tax=Decemunciger sp. AB-2017 TaxID=1980157 RepID=A0A1X9ZNS3_9ANNE